MDEIIQKEDKARLFAFIFGREENKRWTLSLYNAINGTHYENTDDVEITTMEDTIYMGMKNDVSFIINNDLNLYEHQSSYNPNMPVRQLMYLGRLYDKHIKKTNQNQYGSKTMSLPMPRLMTFYNGKSDKEDAILRLSDSFPKGCDLDESDVEVKVHMVNIRPQYNSRLLDECKSLYEYSWFIEEIRMNKETMDISVAVDKAINEMPDDFEIKSFLIGHKAEVTNMCLTEYNEAETMNMFKEEGREEGLEQARAEIVENMLKKNKTIEEIVDFCNLPEDFVREVEKRMHVTV